MNQTLATLLGTLICCINPLLCFAAGIYYARYGLPVEISWRGIRRKDDSTEES